MKKPLRFAFGTVFAATAMMPVAGISQSITFSDQTSLLPSATFHSGNSIGVCDMNNDHKDDIVRSDNNTMYIETQQAANAAFTEQSHTFALSAPWGMCVGDVNNDGFNDVLWGENGSVRMMYWNGSGYTGQNVTTALSTGSIFVQGANFFDINNDGNLDAFVCNDVAMPHIFLGDGATGWTFNQSVMPLATVPSSDNSGNYASIWTDINNDGLIDLMITHCRQSVTNASDARRIDQVFINNGNGTYTQDVTNWTNLRDGAQGWSTAWGDIDNDGDMDAVVLNYDVNSTLMINNGSGVFTNMISGSGISNTTSFFGMNATFQDFDNDTYLDLMFTGDNHYLYKGNGNGTFTLVTPNAFPYSSNTITSHAVGDLNGDGFLDVFASYCNVYNSPSTRNDKLWMNSTNNGNHYIIFDLVGTASNKNGVGAIVKIYGPWGVQVREIRSGEAYGIQNSFAAHFGLGANTAIDSMSVLWPSGTEDHLLTLPADQHYTITEGGYPLSAGAAPVKAVEANVYPNPASDIATIVIRNADASALQNMNVTIRDINGRTVFTQQSLSSANVTFDATALTSGMYFYEVNNAENRIVSGKFLVK